MHGSASSVPLVFGELTQPRTHLSYHPCTVCKEAWLDAWWTRLTFPSGIFNFGGGDSKLFENGASFLFLLLEPSNTRRWPCKNTHTKESEGPKLVQLGVMPLGHRKGMEGLRVPVQIEYNRPKRLVIGCVRWRPNGRFCEMRISRNQTQSLLGISESLSIERLGWLLD